MKRFLIVLLAVGALALMSRAQTVQFNVGYGGYTQMDASDCHDGWSGVNNAWGALTAGFSIGVLDNFYLGPSYTFSSTTVKGEHSPKIAYHAILLNGRYNYYRNRIVTCYGHLGIGTVVSHMQPGYKDSFNRTYFAYQIVPVGAEVGLTGRTAIYGELGFGAQGLLQVGCRFRL